MANKRPSRKALESALKAAGEAHHEYESGFLVGVRDGTWAGWYAAYTLGRLGDFVSPTKLTHWLEEAEAVPGEEWEEIASRHVDEKLEEMPS